MPAISTPWGSSEDLRSRALDPGPGTTREQAERSRRERLYAATVIRVAEHGYETTTVAHLTETAHVSRTAFYAQFRSKQDCFVATVREIARLSRSVARQAFDSRAAWDQRLLAMLEAIATMVAEQPATATVVFRDAYVAGPEAIAGAESSLAMFDELAHTAIAESPTRADLAPEVVRAVLGGIHFTIEDHVRTGRQAELPEQVPALWRWALAYETPSAGLRKPRLAAGSPGTPRRILHDPEERIMTAVVETIAEQGYGETTVADIARAAAVSLSTFYATCDSKEDAFVAVLERGRAQALAAVAPPFQRAPDWEHAVRAGLKAALGFLAVETSWARVAVEARAAGDRAAAHAQETMRLLSQLLLSGGSAGADVPGVAREAVGGAIYSLVAEEIRAGHAERLPELLPLATYICVAPFAGSERAGEIASLDATTRA